MMIPLLDKEKCIKCGKCIQICGVKAIDQDFIIDEDKCNCCLHCMAICPHNVISYDGKKGIEFNTSGISPGEFENLVHKRRSIRKYKDIPVPDGMINKISELLAYAPTGTNTQKVYITIVMTRERLNILSDKMMRFFKKSTAFLLNPLFHPLWSIAVGNKNAKKIYGFKRFVNKYFEGENILTYNAPCIFIFHAPVDSSTPDQDCNIWSTIGSLYAETLGLGTCFNGFVVLGLNMSKKLKSSLDIPKKHKVYSTFLVGFPDIKFLRGVVREETKVNIIK